MTAKNLGPSAKQPPVARFLPRLDDIVFIASFLLVVLFGPQLLNTDGDLGRHLVLGEYMLQSRSIPTADVLSHTMPGQPFTPHEWLSEVIFALSHRLLGLDGVVVVCALVIALTFTTVFRIAVRRSGLRLASLALTLLAASASSLHWLARPHLFTLLLVAVWTDELESLARRERTAWWRLPVLMLVWANLHGAFIIGFTIWLAYLAEAILGRWLPISVRFPPAPTRPLLLAGALSLTASVLNPAGIRIWATPLGFVGNAYLMQRTAECLPPDFQHVGTWPFALLMLVSLVLLVPGLRRVPPRSLLVLAAWTGLGLYTIRNIPIAAVLAVPILAQAAAAALPGSRFGASWLRREAGMRAFESRLRGRLWSPVSVLLATALLAAGVRMTPLPGGNAFSGRVFPVQAMDWLQAHPPSGRVFNYFTWGGYMLHRAWPDVTVFIDAQTDFYGEALTRQYEQVITLSGDWQKILADYNVSWVLMPADSGLVRALGETPGWSEVYRDGTAVILQQLP